MICEEAGSSMTRQEFLRLVRSFPVAAVKSTEDAQLALASDVLLLFVLKGDAFQLPSLVARGSRWWYTST